MALIPTRIEKGLLIEYTDDGQEIGIYAGDFDPSLGAGFEGPDGSIFFHSDGRRFSKVGILDTAWRVITPTNKVAYFKDDFIGSSSSTLFKDDIWDSLVNGVGSKVSTSAGTGGRLRIRAGSSVGYYGELLFNKPVCRRGDNINLTFRGNFDVITDLASVLGLWQSSEQQAAQFVVNSASLNWQTYTFDGTNGTTLVSSVPIDININVFKIITSSSKIDFYVNDVLLNSHTTNLPTILLKPDFYVETTGGVVRKEFLLDFVELYMDRLP
jgi:hypothetical protein